MNWDAADFALFGAMIAGVGGAYALATTGTTNTAYRLAIGVALAAIFLLVWLILAVGVLADEGDPADLMYVGVFAVGLLGAVIARFQPRGMALALLATAFAQALVAALALIAGLHRSPISSVFEILGLNGVFVALFLGSAWLFRLAANAAPEPR